MCWTYRQETRTNESYDFISWINHVNDANKFITRFVPSHEYTEMFDVILSYRYDINLLANRQIVSGICMKKRYINFNLNQKKKNKTSGCGKLSSAFENGALYMPFCRNNACESSEWWKKYSQSFDNTLHDGRSNKVPYLLTTVNRASNAAVKISNALAFPDDADEFYCMLNTKDLKSAGEQHCLTNLVIMTEETNENKVYDFLKSICVDNKEGDKLILNGFIIDCFYPINIETLIKINDFHI
jgi:hypothetical protein